MKHESAEHTMGGLRHYLAKNLEPLDQGGLVRSRTIQTHCSHVLIFRSEEYCSSTKCDLHFHRFSVNSFNVNTSRYSTQSMNPPAGSQTRVEVGKH